MGSNEAHYRISEIFEQIPGVNVRPNHKSSFRFLIYMTPTLEKTDIEVLDLSVRSSNALHRAQIFTIGQLCDRVLSERGLNGIRNCGKNSIAEIMDSLFCYHYSLLSDSKRGTYLAKVIEMNVVAGGIGKREE